MREEKIVTLEDLPIEVWQKIFFFVKQTYYQELRDTYLSLRLVSRKISHLMDDMDFSDLYQPHRIYQSFRGQLRRTHLYKDRFKHCPEPLIDIYYAAIIGDTNSFIQSISKVIESGDFKRAHLNQPLFQLTSSTFYGDDSKASLLTILARYGNTELIQASLPIFERLTENFYALLKWNCYRPFYEACVYGKADTAALLFELCPNEYRHTMLKFAIGYPYHNWSADKMHVTNRYCCVDEITMLKNWRRSHRYAVFADSARRNHFDVVTLLLRVCPQAKKQKMIKADGYMAFIAACAYADESLVNLLWSLCLSENRQKMLSTSYHAPLRNVISAWRLDRTQKILSLYSSSPKAALDSVVLHGSHRPKRIHCDEIREFVETEYQITFQNPTR